MSDRPPTPPQNSISDIVENFLENIVYPNAGTAYTQRAAFANAFNRLIRQRTGPLFQPPTTMSSVLEQSFYDDTAVKKIASPQGLALLQDVSYNTEDIINSTCPITFEVFDETTTVCVMPCKHGFNKTALLEWLQESNMCPICRFELHSSECSILNRVDSSLSQQENEEVHDSSNNNTTVANSSIAPVSDNYGDGDGNNDGDDNSDDNGVGDGNNDGDNDGDENDVQNENIPYLSTTHFFPLNQLMQQSFLMEEQSLMQQALYNSIVEQTAQDELENQIGQEIENMNDLSNETMNDDADEYD